MRYSTICIFMSSGKTFTFKSVRIICDNESVIQFQYSAMSDGREKTATFPKSNIAGWSVTAE